MLKYVKYLFKQLKYYNRMLADIALIQSKWWAMFAEGDTIKKWMFQPDGRLLISTDGNISYGSWEYVNSTQQLIVGFDGNKILLNQNFLYKNVLLLTKDSLEASYLVFYDEKNFSKHDFVQYLKEQKRKELNIKEILLIDDKTVQIIRNTNQYEDLLVGNKVSFDDKLLNDEFIETKNSKILELSNGAIENIYYKRTYKWNGNEIQIKQQYPKKINANDTIFNSNKTIGDGLLRLSYTLGVFFENSTIKSVYYIRRVKTILGKKLEIWTKEKEDYGYGYVFINGTEAPDGYYLLVSFKLIKVKNGRIYFHNY